MIFDRLRSCEQAIGLMKNMQSSLEIEEKFVDGAIESLESLPTATATHELDVSIFLNIVKVFHSHQVQVICLPVYKFHFICSKRLSSCTSVVSAYLYVLPDYGERKSLF